MGGLVTVWTTSWGVMDTKAAFRAISGKMAKDFEISAQIHHSGSKGEYREDALRSFLEEGRLPGRFGIGKGEIVGPARNVSRQSDLIIHDQLDGVSLVHSEATQVYPIECVAGTIEVKSTLSKTKFLEALENIKSVKRLVPRETVAKPMAGGFTLEYGRPCPFGAVFGYQLGRNSLSSLFNNLVEWERENPKEYWPNVIAVLGEGVIHHYRGLRPALSNEDLSRAEYPSSLHYGEDTLFKFYAAVIDLCTSTQLGPVVLSRYFEQAEQLGDYLVYGHDQFRKPGREEVYKLTEAFVERVVEHCRREGGMSEEEVLKRRFGQVPDVLEAGQLRRRVFLYNPEGLKGVHELDAGVTVKDGVAYAPEGSMEPCQHIVVDGEVYYFPMVYVCDGDLEMVPGAKASEL